MDTATIVILAVLALFLALALGGAAANRRRRAAGEGAFRAEIERANRDLAAAHAADNGWEPSRVAEAARTAFAAEHPNAQVSSIELVQVIDPPGTEDDKAVFLVLADDGEHRLTLGREGDSWHLETLN